MPIPMSDSLAITWLGHSAFLLRFPSGARIALDPWLGNPDCPVQFRKPEALGRLDAILLSHGHDDHAGGAVALARASEATVVCGFELGRHLQRLGAPRVLDMGIGGSVTVAGVEVSMTMATHSSSTLADGRHEYLGHAAGYVLRSTGAPTIYFAGDTGLFGDMKIIAEVHTPAIAFLPIGGRYTMGPEAASVAARWLRVQQVVPMHWGRFPGLTGTPDALKGHLAGSGVDVLELQPGETAE
jgi:L-ascorbate metabolism protein UlaG (beta-lactamase superfamily)